MTVLLHYGKNHRVSAIKGKSVSASSDFTAVRQPTGKARGAVRRATLPCRSNLSCGFLSDIASETIYKLFLRRFIADSSPPPL